MPSQVLHILFGEDVIYRIHTLLKPVYGNRIDRILEKILFEHKDAFALGCQGPDIFYHNQRTRPVSLEYGTLLHRRGYGAFSAVLLEMTLPVQSESKDDILQRHGDEGINLLGAYALGFMTHAFLDRHAHPYIVYKSGWVTPAKPETERYKRTHIFLERILDVLMLSCLRGIHISTWNQEGFLSKICEDPPGELKLIIEKALLAAFPERAADDKYLKQRIENAFLDAAFFYKITDPRKTSLHRRLDKEDPFNWMDESSSLSLVYPEKLDLGVDYLNLSRKSWIYPRDDGKKDYRSFIELYEAAVDFAAKSFTAFIRQYIETGIFPVRKAVLCIGNGGLSIQDGQGKPQAPTRSDPLPLDRVLEQQMQLRLRWASGN